jgi:hypothetical protein
MRFELTISGLCVIAMKSKDTADPRPKNPERVDIIVPAAHHHKCRLVWDPQDVLTDIEPTLIVNTQGDTMASLDLDRQGRNPEHAILKLALRSKTDPGFEVSWGPDAKEPAGPSEETWLNWVPRMEELGFPSFPVPEFGTDAPGVRARISLPFGKIIAADVVTQRGSGKPLLWDFVAGAQHAVANKVVYVADDIDLYDFQTERGQSLLRLELEGPRVVKMCISNDMEKVPKDFNKGISDLQHLSHVDVLVPADANGFVTPQSVASQRTGNRICTQVVNVWA